MKNQSQFVTKQLLKNGKVSRNECLRNSITRLGAVISILKADGWKFDEIPSSTGQTMTVGRYVKTKGGNDYVYTLVSKPKK